MKKIAKKQKLTIEQIVDIAQYGMEWYIDNEVTCERSKSYFLGAKETTAHVLACMVCQNILIDVDAGVPTSDMVDLICGFPDKKTLKKRIEGYVKEVKAYT